MNNRILAITRNIIPYVKELNCISGGVIQSLIMQQMDYWFDKYPDGFYKFLEPSTHPAYSEGKSWCEELGMSIDEFRTGFDRIGIRYASKSEFMAATDLFKGKFYASYVDRRTNLTHYTRNHALIDMLLDQLMGALKTGHYPEELQSVIHAREMERSRRPRSEKKGAKVTMQPQGTQVIDFQADGETPLTGAEETPSTVNRETRFTVDRQEQGVSDTSQVLDLQAHGESSFTVNRESRFTVNGDSPSQGMGKPEDGKPGNPISGNGVSPDRYTEPTEEPTAETTTTTTSQVRGSSSPMQNNSTPGKKLTRTELKAQLELLAYPRVTPEEIVGMKHLLLEACNPLVWQQVLDEVEGRRRKGFDRGGPTGFCRALCSAVGRGEFKPNLGPAVAVDRQQRAQVDRVGQERREQHERNPVAIDLEKLNGLPAGIRERTLRSLAMQQEKAKHEG